MSLALTSLPLSFSVHSRGPDHAVSPLGLRSRYVLQEPSSESSRPGFSTITSNFPDQGSSLSPCLGPWIKASAPPGNLLEMHFLRLCPRSTGSVSIGLKSCPGSSGLKATAPS